MKLRKAYSYYNEHDPYAAKWLENLIKKGLISDGVVDTRSIEDVIPEDLEHFNQCHFFAGIGVWSYALRKAGVSDDENVWTGSCPCQPFSSTGQRKGLKDERHLWPTFFNLIRSCKPKRVMGEQVASKDGLAWLDLVYTDLEDADYSVRAVDTCAAGFGAPNIRQRLYWVADSNSSQFKRNELQSRVDSKDTRSRDDSSYKLQREGPDSFWKGPDWICGQDQKWRPIESGTFPLAHGITQRVGQLRAYGNALNAEQAIGFIEAIYETT